MTAAAPAATLAGPPPGAAVTDPRPALATDVAVLAGRHLRLMSRRPASIISAIVLPLVFALLFFTVFSRVMRRSGIDYIDYLLPAVVIQTVFFTGMSAAILAAEDALSGTLRRLRAMSVSRSAPALGLLAAELVRSVVSLGVLLAVGAALGFRFHGGPWKALGFPVVMLAFGAALVTCHIALGLAIRRLEAVTTATNLIYFPFMLLSSAFTPASAFPSWLRPLVEQQPVSRVADALRALTAQDAALARPLLIAGAWLLGLLLLGVVGATRAIGRPS
ncbi:ABC transporter permease [Frankia sp. CNm7]|uniref:Transport permease protein n=1 Tax=Frankia nepalensis TaxID=1836974 RepID=A0A937UNN3_9ACTN|nr:ABC transporter permease [Frankia nepalensis]MBL7502695.1 ABC transporter permease [Frankia nepalensis]MBL7514044.1 ABC transporter permease [Frankia nepalensis]MBL7520213.1 ABC transporter permease [Frankia nepalensis]MBL7626430.1 ABC transporter permease [Frankia nepalensis]